MVNIKRWWQVQEKACWDVPPAHTRAHTSAVRIRTVSFYEQACSCMCSPAITWRIAAEGKEARVSEEVERVEVKHALKIVEKCS